MAAGVTAALAIEPWDAPSEDARRLNPVEPTAESLAGGREFFRDLCTPCHGEDGRGDPDVEETLGVEIGDLTSRERLDPRTDGELHWLIRKGSDNMPEFEADLTDTQTWDLVNYVRSLAGSGEGAEP